MNGAHRSTQLTHGMVHRLIQSLPRMELGGAEANFTMSLSCFATTRCTPSLSSATKYNSGWERPIEQVASAQVVMKRSISIHSNHTGVVLGLVPGQTLLISHLSLLMFILLDNLVMERGAVGNKNLIFAEVLLLQHLAEFAKQFFCLLREVAGVFRQHL